MSADSEELDKTHVLQVITNGSERCLSRVLRKIHGMNIKGMEGIVRDVREDSLRVQIDVFDPLTQKAVDFAIIATRQSTSVNDAKVKDFTAIFKHGNRAYFEADCTEVEEGQFFWTVTHLFTNASKNEECKATVNDNINDHKTVLFDCCNCNCGERLSNIAKSAEKQLFTEWAFRHMKTVCDVFTEFNYIDAQKQQIMLLSYQSMIDFVFDHFSSEEKVK